MSKPVCAVLGVGPGNGAAFARRFATAGYQVALLSRNEDYLRDLAATLTDAKAYAYDATDPQAVSVFERIEKDMGPVDILLYNAGAGVFGNLDKITTDDFERAWRINALGLMAASQAVVPQMRRKGGGAIIVTGATSAVKHSANFSAFTSAKAAQRALTQSMARYLGPEKIHVAYVIVDGVIDLERTRNAMPDKPDTFFLKPDSIADAVYFLAHQKEDAWTFELDLRPFGETW